MRPNNPHTRGSFRRIHRGNLQKKSLWIVITLVLGLGSIRARAFADLPEAKSDKPNLAAGRQAIKAQDFKAAVKSLTKAVQENPQDADAQTMLGYSYRKLGTFDKSLEHYQMALKIDGNHRSAQEYLGELYLDMKQSANAEKQLKALKKACPLFGKCAEYHDLKEAIDLYKSNNVRAPA
ncbi:MAG TPA: tetratricopeptide repeat protein [Verrucomicrobiae bacterium]|nr:tetratricopeptide repeat protein [Verrucomicrobiae bacterium]